MSPVVRAEAVFASAVAKPRSRALKLWDVFLRSRDLKFIIVSLNRELETMVAAVAVCGVAVRSAAASLGRRRRGVRSEE